MGKVTVTIKLTNLQDVYLQRAGTRKEQPRQTDVEALVATGATRLYLKPSVVRALGLEQSGAVSSKTSSDSVVRTRYEAVVLELMGRREVFDVVEVPEDVPNLLGQVPLEVLDLVIDPRSQRLVANPEHGGQQMIEEYFDQFISSPQA